MIKDISVIAGNNRGAGRLTGILVVGGIFTAVFVVLVIAVMYLSKREKEKFKEEKAVKNIINLTVAVDSQELTDVLFDTALKKEYFSDEFLQLKIVRKNSTREALDSLGEGESQVALVDIGPLLEEKGFYLIAPISNLLLWGVTKNEQVDNEVENLASLKSYPLLSDVQKGNGCRILLDQLAHQANVTIRFEKVIDYEEFFRLKQPPEILLTSEPGISQALKFDGKVCFRLTPATFGFSSPPPIRYLVVKESYLQNMEGREVTSRFHKALEKASHLIYTNPTAVLNDVLSNIYFGRYDLEVLAEVIQRLVREKVIPQKMEVSPLAFTQLVRVLLEAQGKDGSQAEELTNQILWQKAAETTDQ
jgi:hypothetical protein